METRWKYTAQEPGASSPSPPLEDGKRETWRWAEEGDITVEGKVKNRYKTCGSKAEGVGGWWSRVGLGTYWVKENKMCHLENEDESSVHGEGV